MHTRFDDAGVADAGSGHDDAGAADAGRGRDDAGVADGGTGLDDGGVGQVFDSQGAPLACAVARYGCPSACPGVLLDPPWMGWPIHGERGKD